MNPLSITESKTVELIWDWMGRKKRVLATTNSLCSISVKQLTTSIIVKYSQTQVYCDAQELVIDRCIKACRDRLCIIVLIIFFGGRVIPHYVFSLTGITEMAVPRIPPVSMTAIGCVNSQNESVWACWHRFGWHVFGGFWIEDVWLSISMLT